MPRLIGVDVVFHRKWSMADTSVPGMRSSWVILPLVAFASPRLLAAMLLHAMCITPVRDLMSMASSGG